MKINFENLDVYSDAQILNGYNHLNKEVKKRNLKKIDISLGGERLYVQPFSYVDRYNSPQNKIFYFYSEIYPYENYNILNINNQTIYLYDCNFFIRLWYWLILRLWVIFKAIGKYYKFDFSYFYKYFNFYIPVIASDNPDIRFSLPHQIYVEDEFGLTHTYYLAPTDEWVEEQIALLFKDSNWIEDHEKIYHRYLSWRDGEVLKGRRIGFLTSIDT